MAIKRIKAGRLRAGDTLVWKDEGSAIRRYYQIREFQLHGNEVTIVTKSRSRFEYWNFHVADIVRVRR